MGFNFTMHNTPRRQRLLQKIRLLLVLFIIGLVLSGLTAFPLERELNLVARLLGAGDTARAEDYSGLTQWIVLVRNGLSDTYSKYPFIAYGTDWLAFAHLMIAIAFIGPLRDPVRNIWVIEFGLIACAAIIPLALICSPLRGIPFAWQLIDCPFGVVGAVPLWLCRHYTRQMEGVGSRA